MSSLDYLDLCRLCLVKDRVSVPIFEGEGDVRQIFLKITACLPVKVNREDKLPKKICDDCVYKIELCYQFWHTTANAEKQLLQWLGEVNMEDKQGYNVLNPNGMKPSEQSNENRLDGTVMQQVSEHQNNMNMGMMDNMGLSMPMMMSSNAQQQITSVPMDTSGSSVQNVQPVAGPSTQTTHDQITQNQTDAPTQQEEEDESSEEDENSDDECDGDEGLPIKEESEEDPNNSRTIEPTTFVNVSLACDEAGPSGLQQQKIPDMPEIVMPQTADVDPKTGSEPLQRDPLQQSYLVIQNNNQYYLLPIPDSSNFVKNGGKSDIVEPSRPSLKVKEEPVEVVDISTEEPEEIYKDVDDEMNSASEIHNENMRYTCPYCWLKFDKDCNLRDHMMVHNTVYPFECTICGIRLETKTLLKSHEFQHESGMELFHCAHCDFKSAKASSITCHQIKWHTNVYKCQFCFELFQNKALFLKHMEFHNAVVICDVCDQVCEDNCHLTQHKRKHQDDKSYIHSQFEAEDVYLNEEKQSIKKCEPDDVDLQEHSDGSFNGLDRDLSLPKEERFFKCSQCRWSFRTISSLNKHMKRHARKFKCNKCNAVFKYKASYRNHKYKHETDCEY